MHRGCMSLGEVQCDDCHRIIPHPERYLAVEEKDSVEVEKSKVLRYCIDCCLKKGYARYVVEKDDKVLTFFGSEP